MEQEFNNQVIIRLSDGDDTELILTQNGVVIVGTEQGYFSKADFMEWVFGGDGNARSFPQAWQAWEGAKEKGFGNEAF